MTNSRAKGANGERELAAQFSAMGYTSRRTQQYCGTAGDSDVVVDELPGLHFECKRVERLNIDNAMAQASTDAAKAGAIPAVCHRKNGGEWMITVRLADMHVFAAHVHGARSRA
jgi:Holliday junction resolvase